MIGAEFTGKDMNKFERPMVAEFGGVTVIFGFIMAIMFALFYHTYVQKIFSDLIIVMGSALTIILIGFIGFIDDFLGWKKGLHQWQHFLLPIFAALPMMALNVGTDTMVLPFLGLISLGIYYSLIVVPVGITGAANVTNLLAGFNGLEAGMGIIIGTSLLIVAFSSGEITAAIILISLIGALIGFLIYNKYPSQIFPGDSLTLMLGGTFATAAIIGSMEKVAVLLIFIYAIEFFIKLRHRFKTECFGIASPDGSLAANPKGGSLTHFVLRLGQGKLKEGQVVLIFWGMQILLSAIVLILHFNKLI